MKPQLTILYVDDLTWRVAFHASDGLTWLDVPCEATASLVQKGEALANLLHEHRAAIANPVLALPSRWCLPACIDTRGLLRRGRRSAMTYRLEEKLPVDAETFVADFIEHSGQALGIAIEIQPIAEILKALEKHEVAVGTIAPIAMLALEQLQIERRENLGDLVLLESAHGLDAILLSQDHPTGWHHVPAAPEALRRELNHLTRDCSQPLGTSSVGLTADNQQIAQQHSGVDLLHEHSTDPAELAGQRAHAIAVGGEASMVNLRRDALAQPNRLQQVKRPLGAAAIALAILLFAIGGTAYWRSIQHEQLAEHLEAEQVALFQENFPNQETPAAILARLRSELHQQQGLRGPADDSENQALDTTSALTLLYRVLENLPADLRYRVLELRLDAQDLYLDGQARGHGDAEQIAAGLREPDLWEIRPPRTEQLRDRGVSFTLTGDLKKAPSSPAPTTDDAAYRATAERAAGGGP